METLQDRPLFRLPDDRISYGQACCSPDGRWFVYNHHDRAALEKMKAIWPDPLWGCYSRGTAQAAFNLDTGEHRELLRMDFVLHHAQPLGKYHLVISGMHLTDYQGGWYTKLRSPDEDGSAVHHIATTRGIAYEVSGAGGVLVGMMNPFTFERIEIPMPPEARSVHTGCDPEGRLWFYENRNTELDVHDIYFLASYDAQAGTEWIRLIGNWPTYGGRGQRAHFHPILTPDRRWILFTAGDPSTETNHLFLLDVSDLTDTRGVDQLERKFGDS